MAQTVPKIEIQGRASTEMITHGNKDRIFEVFPLCDQGLTAVSANDYELVGPGSSGLEIKQTARINTVMSAKADDTNTEREGWRFRLWVERMPDDVDEMRIVAKVNCLRLIDQRERLPPDVLVPPLTEETLVPEPP